jgi:transcriptional regulator with XRE-family HTH domain
MPPSPLRALHPIRRRRLELGWTEAELAALVGRGQPWVSRIESGERIPGPADRVALARVLGLSVRELGEAHRVEATR